MTASSQTHSFSSVLTSIKQTIPGLILLAGFVYVALYYHFDMRVLAAGVVLIALVSNVFAWCVGLLGFLPWIGPLLVKVLHLPFVWIINGLGYILSFMAIRAGHGEATLNYRLLTIVFLSGAICGYIIAILSK